MAVTPPTSLGDILPTNILLNSCNNEFQLMFHSEKTDSSLSPDSIKNTILQFEREVKQIVLNSFKNLQKLFKPKRILVDRYGDTHRQDLLRLFNHYNPAYLKYFQRPLWDHKKLYGVVFKNYDYSDKKCFEVIILVIRYIMVLDKMRIHQILGNVRLFKNNDSTISSIDILKRLQELVFETQRNIYDTLRANGYKLIEVQFPQYCTLYKVDFIGQLMATGIELSVLATYLANTRLHDSNNILVGLNKEPNSKQAVKNLNVLVGFLKKYGVPSIINNVRLYDYLLYEQDPKVVETFLFQFLLTFKSVLKIPPHVVTNEISKISGSNVKLQKENEMFLTWSFAVGQKLNRTFKQSEYDYFLPYLYIVSYYTKIEIHRIRLSSDVNKNRNVVLEAMQDALKQLNIPRNLFDEKCVDACDEHTINHLLSFLFYYTQSNNLIGHAINVISKSIKHYITQKNIIAKRKFVSSLFHTITIMKEKNCESNFKNIINSTKTVQFNTFNVLFENIIQLTQTVQSCIKSKYYFESMTNSVNSVIEVQSVIRSHTLRKKFDSFNTNTENVQALYRYTIANKHFNEIMDSSINIQSLLRFKFDFGNYTLFKHIINDVRNVIESKLEEIRMKKLVKQTITTQTICKSTTHSNIFNTLEKETIQTQSLFRMLNTYNSFKEINNSIINIQSLLKSFTLNTQFEIIIVNSVVTSKSIRQFVLTLFYDELNKSNINTQSNCRTLINSNQFSINTINSISTQSQMRKVIMNTNYNNIIDMCVLSQLFSQTKLLQFLHESNILSQQNTASVIRNNFQINYYNTIVTNTRNVQALYRYTIANKHFNEIMDSSINIQSLLRFKFDFGNYTLFKHIINDVRNVIESKLEEIRMKKLVKQTIITQTICKSTTHSNIFNTLEKETIQTQSLFRMLNIYNSFKEINNSIINIQSLLKSFTLNTQFEIIIVNSVVTSKSIRQFVLTLFYDGLNKSNINTQSNCRTLINSNQINIITINSVSTQSQMRKIIMNTNYNNIIDMCILSQLFSQTKLLQFLHESNILSQQNTASVIRNNFQINYYNTIATNTKNVQALYRYTIANKHFNEIMDSSINIQSLSRLYFNQFYFSTFKNETNDVRNVIESKLEEIKMRKLVKQTIITQTICKSTTHSTIFNTLEKETIQTQSLFRMLNIYNSFKEINNSIINIQSLLKSFTLNTQFEIIIVNSVVTSKSIRQFVLTLFYDELNKSNINTQSSCRTLINSNQFTSVINNNFQINYYNTIVTNTRNVQALYRYTIANKHFNEIMDSSINIQSLLRFKFDFGNYTLFKHIINDVRNVIESKLEEIRMKKLVKQTITTQTICKSTTHSNIFNTLEKETIQTQSLFRMLNIYNSFKEINNSIINIQSLLKSFTLNTQFEIIIVNSTVVSKELKEFIQNSTYKTYHNTLKNIQSNCRTLINSNQINIITINSVSTQSQMRKVIMNTNYNNIIDMCILSQLFSQTKLLQFLHESNILSQQNTASVIRNNFQINYYNTIATNTKNVQALSISYEKKKSIDELNRKSMFLQTIIQSLIQRKLYNYIVEYSIFRKLCTPQIVPIIKNQFVYKNYIIGSLKKRSFKGLYDSTKVMQTLLNKLNKKTEYSDIVEFTHDIQSVCRCMYLKQDFIEVGLSTIYTQALLHKLLILNSNKEDLENHYQQCQHQRNLTKCVVKTQSICRGIIVKYGADLDDEVLRPLSFSCELYELFGNKTQQQTQYQTSYQNTDVTTSPKRCKREDSPTKRILPKEVIMNALILNKSTCLSPDKTILLKYLRESKRSVIDVAFSNIKMIQRRRLDEIQIGFKQLSEQIKSSEWFRVMFVKYGCIDHIIHILKSSNKSPPFIELVEAACHMLYMLVYHKQSLLIFQHSNMVTPTIEKVIEIIRNYMNIKVLCAATKLLVLLAKSIPEVKEKMVDVCNRLKNKLPEIETKEKMEYKHVEAVAAKTKKDVVYEKASSHIKLLIKIVTETK
ncbi:hypothetical protein QTN25_000896 [Entamoeba marina]